MHRVISSRSIALNLLLAAIIFALGFPSKGISQEKPREYYEISEVVHEEVDIYPPEVYAAQLGQNALNLRVDRYSPVDQTHLYMDPFGLDIDFGKIISRINGIIGIGEKIWQIIDEEKPTAKVDQLLMHALPEEISSLQEMTGWAMPHQKGYRIQMKNYFGMTVVDLVYRVVMTPQGRFKGKGQYLANAQILPQKIEAAWGYHVNMDGFVSSVLNGGTLEEPVARLQIGTNIKISTRLKMHQITDQYLLSGDGEIRKLNLQ
jgi:hypothetical protein